MKMKFAKIFTYLFIIVSMLSCNDNQVETELKSGIWRGEIKAQNNSIPFNFEVSKFGDNYKIILINGDESLKIDEVIVSGDSLFFNMHIFDSSIKAKINDTLLTGIYTKNYVDDYTLVFKAEYGKKNRFDNMSSNGNFDGTWETTFFPGER